MPEFNKVRDALDTYAEYHSNLGFDINDDFKLTEGESTFTGWFYIQREELEIYLIGCPEWNFVMGKFQYDLVKDVASRLSEEDVERWADPIEEVDEVPMRTWAAVNILNNIDQDSFKQIEYKLSQYIRKPGLWGTIQRDFQLPTSGFEIQANFFPYDEGISRRDYNHQFSSLVMNGLNSLDFLRYTLRLDSPEVDIVDLASETTIDD
jgi:hypothetical protein